MVGIRSFPFGAWDPAYFQGRNGCLFQGGYGHCFSHLNLIFPKFPLLKHLPTSEWSNFTCWVLPLPYKCTVVWCFLWGGVMSSDVPKIFCPNHAVKWPQGLKNSPRTGYLFGCSVKSLEKTVKPLAKDLIFTYMQGKAQHVMMCFPNCKRMVTRKAVKQREMMNCLKVLP